MSTDSMVMQYLAHQAAQDHYRATGLLPEVEKPSLEVRSVALQGALWETIAKSKEDNLAVLIDALSALTKRVSGYNMKAETEVKP